MHIYNHNIELINNDKLLSSTFKYVIEESNGAFYACHDKIKEIFYIKFDTFNIKINTLTLDTMDMAYEIYKLGDFICSTNLRLYSFEILQKLKFFL